MSAELLDEIRALRAQQQQTNALLRTLIAAVADEDLALCPACGSNQVQQTPAFGAPDRQTCSSCGVSFTISVSREPVTGEPEPAEVPVG